jgi:hypothetical protein
LWLALFASAAWAGVEAGFVEDYEGEPSRYRLERGGERVPIAVLTPVQQGDRVFVDHAEGRILLRLGEERAVSVTQSDGPFEVGEADESATVLGNLARWAIGWTEAGGDPALSRVSLTTRGLGLAIPLCPTNVVQRLPTGGSSLQLEWSGGAPPYVARLRREGAVATERAGLTEPHASLDLAVPLAPGAGQLELTDAMGRGVTVELAFVAPVGTDPSPLDRSEEGSALAHLVRAFDSLDRDGDAGRLAAYQELSVVANEFPPAAVVRDAIVRGQAPATPPPWRAPKP